MDYKLGKLPVKYDVRTIQLKQILVPILPHVPDSFDVDAGLNCVVPEQLFGNDAWGDCVIASRANQTLRFEEFEQKAIIPITEKDCLKEYWREEEGDKKKLCLLLSKYQHPDDGLVMLDSLNYWRKGWSVAGKKYDVYAFTGLDKSHLELKQATYFLRGAQIGIQVPQSAIDQFDAGQPWDISNENSEIVGGHAVFVVGYTPNGPVCVTWAKKQPMTWNFYDAYIDEAYGIVDNKDVFISNSPVDVKTLDALLHAIEQGSQSPTKKSLLNKLLGGE